MRYQSAQKTKSSDSVFEAITDIFQWEEKNSATELDSLTIFFVAKKMVSNQKLENNWRFEVSINPYLLQ